MSLRQVLSIVLVTYVSSSFGNLGESGCSTDGGYQLDVACVGVCRDTLTDPPYIAESDPISQPLLVSNDTWCAIVNNYATSGSLKKQWGFCNCNTGSPTITKVETAAPTLSTPSPTIDTTPELVGTTGCSTDGGYQPGQSCFGACRDTLNDAPYVAPGDVIEQPTVASNDTWCAIVNNYATSGSLKKQWGFCDCSTGAPTITKVETAAPSLSPTIDTSPPFLGLSGCTTEAGYQSGQSCVGTCRDTLLNPPFIAEADPITQPTTVPNTTWCPIVNNYATSGSLKKQWGFCNCNTGSPTITREETAAPTVSTNSPTIDSTPALVGATGCSTDGGYQDGQSCVGACRDTLKDAPFVAPGDVIAQPSVASNDTWCAIVNNYATSGSLKKQWGFCDCSTDAPTITKVETAAPSTAPTEWVPVDVFMAENGWLQERTECVFGTVQTVSGGEKVPVDGCLPVANYSLLINEENVIWNPNTNNNTMWCPTIADFKTHLTNNAANKDSLRSWGYCVVEQSTREPTVVPTMSPTVFVPTMEPTSASPSAMPSTAPTPWVSTEIFSAAEGWLLSDSMPCAIGGEVRTASDAEPIIVTGCLSTEGFDLYTNENPAKFTASNNTLWCPTTPVFKTFLNPNVESQRELLKDWGYCSISMSTRAPTGAPVVAPTTANPSMAPVTMSPSTAPSLSPTEFVSQTVYYATGGGVGLSSVSQAEAGVNMEPCAMPFTIKGSDTVYNTCLNVTESLPIMAGFAGLPDFPGAPMNGTAAVDRAMWCPIADSVPAQYNPELAKDKYERWGYCFSVQTTRAPTINTATDSPVAAPTATTPPSTSPPSGEPTSPLRSSSPTTSDQPTSPPTSVPPTPFNNQQTAAPTAAGYLHTPNIVLIAIMAFIMSCSL